ncbi:replication initiation protein, partial [Psychrobacter sp. FME13]|uniref:replication initiation protein RepM n=1 Tax=Psychrobacter sp. FME13 TaxID=2487708 RepID=UPI00178788EA
MSDKKLKNEVVKTHRLNTALQKLSLAEIRLMQLAIIDARETGAGIDTLTPLPIHASRYAEAFGVTRQTAYEVLIEAETSLFKRYFTFLDERDGKPVKSHWVSQAKYLDDEAIIEIMLTPAVVKEITRIDAIEAKTLFTRFALEQVAPMKSVYSVRLYELLNQWKQAKKVSFDLNTFRGQLGVEDTEYKAMSDFKKRVLDLAVNEINEKSDLKVSYEQVKKGVAIAGFKFKV